MRGFFFIFYTFVKKKKITKWRNDLHFMMKQKALFNII